MYARRRFAEPNADDESLLSVVWLVESGSGDSAVCVADAAPRSSVQVAQPTQLRLRESADDDVPLSRIDIDVAAFASVVDGVDDVALPRRPGRPLGAPL